MLLSQPVWAETREPLGTFSDVQYTPEEGDCTGIEVTLWRNDKGTTGQFRDYEGACEAPSLRLEGIQYFPDTGRISFKVHDGLFVHSFDGTLRSDRLKGDYSVSQDGLIAPDKYEITLLKKPDKG